MFDALENKIKEICEEHNVETDEDFINLLYNKDGTERSEFWDHFREWVKNEHSKNTTNYVPVDLSDFSKLSDDDLYDEMPTFVFGTNELNEKQHIALVAYEFEMEFANGGVSQYFANTRGEHIEELVNCLRIIGAESYVEKCEDFISKCNIKVSDFSEDGNDYDFEKIESMYPYEELEDNIMAFYYDEPLSKFIVDFVRANADDFKVTE